MMMRKFFLFQPTMSPASSADMAPISSGSSTWTSSGIPFSFVSMATGISPSSSGSQATVASVLTSTLLAGLGFSGGVISSFPSSVWPSRPPTQSPSTSHQTDPSSCMTETGNALGEDVENCTGEVEDEGKEEVEEEEDDDEDDNKNEKRKKKAKGSGGLDGWSQEYSSSVLNEPTEKTRNSSRKARKPTGSDVSSVTLAHLEYTHNTVHRDSTTCSTNQNAVLSAINDWAVVLRPRGGERKRSWHFSEARGEHHGQICNLYRLMRLLSCVLHRTPI